MDRRAIESRARELLGEIWQYRERFFPMGVPNPIDMLRPEIAAEVLGFSYQHSGPLGTWGQGGDHFEIAGLLDRQRRHIAVSTNFEFAVSRFTAAHEIGHVALNHSGLVMHRDRPVFQLEDHRRDPFEQDADYFSACYLAPGKLVKEAFFQRFRIRPPLPLTDAIAFHLCGESGHALMAAGPSSLKFPAAVARATTFNGRPFVSLYKMFDISISAMAIRLRELGLVEE